MSFETWLAFAAACIVLLIIPGPTILAVISYSISHGKRASGVLVAAVALGDSTALLASLLGLGALLSTSLWWFTVIKVVGGFYLLYLGIKLLLTKGSALFNGENSAANAGHAAQAERESRWGLFWNTYVVTALNPKGIVFFIAFLPQFVSLNSSANTQLFILGATFVILAAVNAFLYAVFASRVRGMLATASAQRRFNLAGGMLLSVAGVWALFARRPV